MVSGTVYSLLGRDELVVGFHVLDDETTRIQTCRRPDCDRLRSFCDRFATLLQPVYLTFNGVTVRTCPAKQLDQRLLQASTS